MIHPLTAYEMFRRGIAKLKSTVKIKRANGQTGITLVDTPTLRYDRVLAIAPETEPKLRTP